MSFDALLGLRDDKSKAQAYKAYGQQVGFRKARKIRARGFRWS